MSQHDRLVEQVRATTQTTCSVAEIRGLLESVAFESERVALMIDLYFEGDGEIRQLERDSWAEVSKGKAKKAAKVRRARAAPARAVGAREATSPRRTAPARVPAARGPSHAPRPAACPSALHSCIPQHHDRARCVLTLGAPP